MKLVSYLQALLSRFTTSAQASTAGMPSSVSQTFSYNPEVTFVTVVAPYDGYISFEGSCADDVLSWMGITNNTANLIVSTNLSTDNTNQIYLPVAMGQSVSLWWGNISGISMKIVRTLGGGYEPSCVAWLR